MHHCIPAQERRDEGRDRQSFGVVVTDQDDERIKSSCILSELGYHAPVSETLSIKVSTETKLRLKALAEARMTKPSVLLREALDLVLSQNPRRSKPSLMALNRDLFEDLGEGGPADLSTNRDYFEGFGE